MTKLKSAAWLAAWMVAAAAMWLGACAKPAPDPIMKAPPAVTKPGTTLTASPDPIVTDDGSPVGETAISWSTPATHVEVHINAPDGQLFFRSGSSGTVRTGKWVNNGMTFYLQDADNPKPGSADATLGSLAVALQ
jgi:hypothetical protein